jgi:hypothetical protein
MQGMGAGGSSRRAGGGASVAKAGGVRAVQLRPARGCPGMCGLEANIRKRKRTHIKSIAWRAVARVSTTIGLLKVFIHYRKPARKTL